jgi:hypothetical protein
VTRERRCLLPKTLARTSRTARSALLQARLDYMGLGFSWGRTEKMAFEGDEKTEFTAGHDGHARATLPVSQDARAHIAHGAKRALVARDPVTVTPAKTRLRIE